MIRVRDHEGVAFVTVHGDIDAALVPMLRDVLTWAVDYHSGVILDLSGAGTADRSGLSVLVQAQDRAHARAVRLCFAQPSDLLQTALSALQAEAMFAMFASCADAFAGFRGSFPRRRADPAVFSRGWAPLQA